MPKAERFDIWGGIVPRRSPDVLYSNGKRIGGDADIRAALACRAEVTFRPTCQRYVKGEHLAVATVPPATKHSEHLKVSYSGRQSKITVEEHKRSRFRKAALSSSCRGVFFPHRLTQAVASLFVGYIQHFR